MMYCPKCGDVLTRRLDGELACERGDMGLSRVLERSLQECFVDRTRIPRGEPFSFAIGGRWWCPGCGVQAEEHDRGDLRCPSCGNSLVEFIHALTELHPHRRGSETAGRLFQSAEAAHAFVAGALIQGPRFELAIAEGFTFAGAPDDSGAGMALVVDAILAQGYQPDGFDERAGFRLYRYVPLEWVLRRR